MRESAKREMEGRLGTEKRKGFIHNLDKGTTSFFITNFPEEEKSEDLWKLFL
jgi:hypothetical protein